LPDADLRFSVIIVNYNGGDYLAGALASLADQTVQDFEVFLVDNASTDGSMQKLGLKLPERLTIRKQSENLGFAAGNNLAAREAVGDWIVLLNPDAEAAPDWLEQLGHATKKYPDIKQFASAQYDLHDDTKMDGAGDAYLGFGIPWRGGFGRSALEMPEEGYCFSPCGAGAMYHRETFLAHGGFEERFFCFCEDVDLGYRMQLAGERCIFLPMAVIEHAGGGLSGRASEFSLFHGARNRLWTYMRNTPTRMLILTLPGHIVITLAILLRGLMTGRAGGTWRGLMAGLKGMEPFMDERDKLKKARGTTVWALARQMSWNPLRMLQRKPDIKKIR